MRVIIGTGSREWKSFTIAGKALLHARGDDPEVHLRTGGARGADMILDMSAHRMQWGCSVYDAQWDDWCPACCSTPTHRVTTPAGRSYCPAAGTRRNTQMVSLGATAGLALFQAGARNKGTIDCVMKMAAARIPVECWCSCGKHGPAPCELHQARGVIKEWHERLPALVPVLS